MSAPLNVLARMDARIAGARLQAQSRRGKKPGRAERLAELQAERDAVAALIDSQRDLYAAYVRALESGHNACTEMGIACDSVADMVARDTALIVAKAALIGVGGVP